MSRGDLGEHYADALSYAVSLANRPAFSRYRIHGALMSHDLILDVQRERGQDQARRLAGASWIEPWSGCGCIRRTSGGSRSPIGSAATATTPTLDRGRDGPDERIAAPSRPST